MQLASKAVDAMNKRKEDSVVPLNEIHDLSADALTLWVILSLSFP